METPEQPKPIPKNNEDLKNIAKELHDIAKELHLLNQILRRTK